MFAVKGCGLSPRVRGNPAGRRPEKGPRRSIPACAGEPPLTGAPPWCRAVYPRVCGGTCSSLVHTSAGLGLSPRVRGNPGGLDLHEDGVRSIPACAGEPAAATGRSRSAAVYPRVCGGTRGGHQLLSKAKGLSPRVRGNPSRPGILCRLSRSIPACAGEPGCPCNISRPPPVYPRVCGGTLFPHRWGNNDLGLSPRVRGNRPRTGATPAPAGSIPACAGEPWCRGCRSWTCTVYPRVCGGTPGRARRLASASGLSPRVRGNRDLRPLRPGLRRSIPACAGEPFTTRNPLPPEPVYPRVCGGTEQQAWDDAVSLGLSPRVRGNPVELVEGDIHGGSIPACAGEPCLQWHVLGEDTVYPRVCGGTPGIFPSAQAELGLSPRVRGNRRSPRPTPAWSGSIPACAGEPPANPT